MFLSHSFFHTYCVCMCGVLFAYINFCVCLLFQRIPATFLVLLLLQRAPTPAHASAADSYHMYQLMIGLFLSPYLQRMSCKLDNFPVIYLQKVILLGAFYAMQIHVKFILPIPKPISSCFYHLFQLRLEDSYHPQECRSRTILSCSYRGWIKNQNFSKNQLHKQVIHIDLFTA